MAHMHLSKALDRRAFLRGCGVALALPWLEAMSLPSLLASPLQKTVQSAPLRLAFIFIPNGVHYADYLPKGTGASYQASPLLESIQEQRNHFSVLSGLSHHNAKALGDGPGDHARSAACFLTGAHPRKDGGLKAGVSIDQWLASRVGQSTRFASLELGCERGLQSGQCDSGYSCAYSSTISWRNESSPVTKETNPRLLFERLFQLGPDRESKNERAKRLKARKSILDSVGRSARRMEKGLGQSDKNKLEEYFNGIRELELRIDGIERMEAEGTKKIGMSKPEAKTRDYREHLRLLYDLSILAFRLDITRVLTFMTANEGSNRNYPFLDIAKGHHSLSHHRGDKDMIKQIQKINRFQFEEFGGYLQRLSEVKEGESTLLDNSMIVFGGAIGDGNRHNHDRLPILLAGSGQGALKPGRHLAYERNTPLCNLYVKLAQLMGPQIERFGDSTGSLDLG